MFYKILILLLLIIIDFCLDNTELSLNSAQHQQNTRRVFVAITTLI